MEAGERFPLKHYLLSPLFRSAVGRLLLRFQSSDLDLVVSAELSLDGCHLAAQLFKLGLQAVVLGFQFPKGLNQVQKNQFVATPRDVFTLVLQNGELVAPRKPSSTICHPRAQLRDHLLQVRASVGSG